jgi:hypothetical protein
MMAFASRDMNAVPLKETKAGTVVSVVLSLVSMGALSVCLCKYHSKTSLLAVVKLIGYSSSCSKCARLVQATLSMLV